MRTLRTLMTAVLAGAGLLGLAGTAVADSPSPSASADAEAAAPTEAGTSFRTATAIKPEQRATADASTGDYLYWVLPVDAGQRATVKAKVTLPQAARHGTATWQLDVYDGLRRRQACTYGAQSRKAAQDAGSVELSCTLRTVRAWAEPWANDPLPGSYYIRLTVTDLPKDDLGLPIRAEVDATTADTGGAHAVDGRLAAPLVPGAGAATPQPEESSAPGTSAALGEPDGGWSSGWWSDRWIWTAVGGLLAALAGIAGYRFTRGSGRPSQVPPGA
ncbi:hypothetical protein SLV14_007288 [Streptomyces sp. Je 1-4]|uniref:hypothetical protein n=1 Tax=Streptomyces TaxID=1883 RepID=UPI0021DAC186|nr:MULTISPECIES: hypothetical protein [unclassified Streptomyces]UYB44215.1 hypothetical protein SLV14_007288 [Streptomyces sp. Je 1-4]UZQ40662.1 hypothetical protein SLV14N_007288 [Streptomyces sp. Je 1-4] [Streptomyces sp. Je 1-4 4N24]UZQ48079.1 hypothetical protein SLV14NA_007288 [Streptomyces sp. Je 1-4] [Streptomyces sp. Je 1-4 4N24_ara]